MFKSSGLDLPEIDLCALANGYAAQAQTAYDGNAFCTVLAAALQRSKRVLMEVETLAR